MSIESNMKIQAESLKRIADALDVIAAGLSASQPPRDIAARAAATDNVVPMTQDPQQTAQPDAEVESAPLPQLDPQQVNLELNQIATQLGDGGQGVFQIIQGMGLGQLAEASNDQLHSILSSARNLIPQAS